jgi:hypothetical protein
LTFQTKFDIIYIELEKYLMKVWELIEQLEQLPRDLPVFIMAHNISVAEPCYSAHEGIFNIEEWEGGGICCDLEEHDAYVSIG